VHSEAYTVTDDVKLKSESDKNQIN